MKNIDKVYNSRLIEEWERFKAAKIEYVLAVDATFDNVRSYCLTRIIVGVKAEIILTKSVIETKEFKKDKSEFQEEVKNLAKYFNAEIIGDWDKTK